LEELSKNKTMVKIRLRRTGARGKPTYRIVVTDSRSPRDGAFIEVIGHYNPLTDPESVDIDKEKASKWLGQGAQPTDTVARLLVKSGIAWAFKKKIVRAPRSAKSKSKGKTDAAVPSTEAPQSATP
jgi:small subunit ribosomal protein S16